MVILRPQIVIPDSPYKSDVHFSTIIYMECSPPTSIIGANIGVINKSGNCKVWRYWPAEEELNQ